MDFKAYGKINLSLDVTGILPNGYHSVSMVMQSVEFCDVVSVEKSDKIKVSCNNPDIPDGKDNLAYKACELMIEKFGISHGFDIKIHKNIPVAGGMAGGSTDAAAVMRGINEMCNLGVSAQQLMELGVTLGADIPFCIQQKPALAQGIGEKLTPIRGLSKDIYILLVNPNISVSTKEIYQRIDNSKMFNRVNNEALVKALKAKNNEEISKNMLNVMEEVTKELCPQIEDIISSLKSNGAFAALMSGSGATCYGLFTDKNDAIKAQSAFNNYFTAITHPVE